MGDVFGADLRSLAVFRIVLAVLVLMVLGDRLSELRVFYTDEGVLPRDVAMDGRSHWRWSILMFNGSFTYQAVVFLGTALASIALLLGYRTRLMSVIVWVLILSVHNRNLLVLSGADVLLLVLTFWAMFLPLGGYWSLDSRLKVFPRAPTAPRILSYGTIGIFLQIAFVYWFTAVLKWGPVWGREGSALYYATGAAHITRSLGEYLHQFPMILRLLTHVSLGLEIFAPLLLFSPVLTGPVRTAAIVIIMAFHAGIFVMLDVDIFPWVGALCMVCFLPGWFWDTALVRVKSALLRRSRAIRRFGGSSMRFLNAKRDGRLKRGRTPEGVPFSSSSREPGLGKVGTTPGGRQTSDDTKPEARTPVAAQLRSKLLGWSWMANLFAALCLVFVFGWNMASVSRFTMPRGSEAVAYGLGLAQTWDMFAPYPPTLTSWHVINGVLQNGQEVNLLASIVHGDYHHMQPVSWEQPNSITTDYYGNPQWRKYLDAIAGAETANQRHAFARYACERWNHHHGGDGSLARVEMYRLSIPTLLDYRNSPIQRETIGHYQCQ